MFDILISMIGFLLIQLILFSVAGLWNLGRKVDKLANHISEIQSDMGELKDILRKNK